MSNYVKTTNFYTKDALASGNPDKIIKGADLDNEFNAIASAIATKPDINNPTFTGTVTATTFAGNVTGNVTGNADSASTANNISNAGGWSVTPNGNSLEFKFNGTKVGTLSSTGDLVVIGNVSAYGTL